MSFSQLRRLDLGRAFNPAPRLHELPSVFVPFDTLTGERTVEHAARTALTHRRRVALIGATGSGKSSVIGHVLAEAGDDLFGLRVPVSIEEPEVAVEPEAFLAHLLRHLREEALKTRPDSRRAIDKAAPGSGRETTRTYTAEAGFAGVKGGLSYAVKQALEEQIATNTRAMEAVRELLGIVDDHGVVPVIVLDDTDKWVPSPLAPQNAQLRGQFFTRILRMLAEQIDATVLLAVHPSYLDDTAFQQARGFLERTIELPTLPDIGAAARLVSRRIALGLDLPEEDLDLDRFVTPDALTLLFEYYEPSTNIRQGLLTPLNGALIQALDADAEIIDVVHVRAELADLDGATWPR
ncbi:hypothetical protein [Mobilicoccus massiliensis]|uniref:hypothetical protein n=1 Tax=Mobilicoccus massiliensis TaxID=1522310 RepID=UPI0005913A5E|nr:hypothetical protein [Mobilicoccus massiliensis]